VADAIYYSIPIRHSVDIFVAGGGPAGVACAVAAARQGRSVFLVEANTCFGGLDTAGLVPAFMTKELDIPVFHDD